jgi:uncharacterized protein YcnI
MVGGAQVRTRAWVGGLVAAAAVVIMATPAAAHITVNPSEAPEGSFQKLTFRVPNEQDDAGTTRVEINLPEDAVIPFVSVQPTPGWTAEVERRTLDEPVTSHGTEISEVVSKVTWTGGTINPGEFQEFNISAGQLPDDVETLEFPAIQTYSNGDEVRWIEETPAGGEEPDYPVPTLALVAAAADDHGDGAEAEEAATDGEQAASPSEDSDDDSNALAVVALVVGGVGVVLGGLALIRRRAT